MRQNQQELDEILAMEGEPTFSGTVARLEEMQDRLHKVWAPVSHLQMVATTDELRDVYNACLPKLTSYYTELGQNARLFELYEAVDSGPDAPAGTPEKRLLEHALRDFRLAGVDLPDEQKKRYKEVMQELAKLQAQFEQDQQRSQSSALAVGAYVPSFLKITARDIEQWADGNLEARSQLPVLLRRLVNSTGQELSLVDFPGYDNAERLDIFCFMEDTASPIMYYDVGARYRTMPPSYTEGAPMNKAELWQETDRLMTEFENSGEHSIFVSSERAINIWEPFFGIKRTDLQWEQLEQRLQQGNRIYDNGDERIYEHSKP